MAVRWLQGRVAHADPPSASILELACLIRGSLQSMTPAKMLQQAGHIKPKNSLLGFFLGPLHVDHVETQVVYGCEVTLARGRLKASSEAIWLSGWSGPAFTDLNYTRDVGFTTFSPLEGDNDFGAGPAYFYHLDTAPMVFLVHPNKGQIASANAHLAIWLLVI